MSLLRRDQTSMQHKDPHLWKITGLYPEPTLTVFSGHTFQRCMGRYRMIPGPFFVICLGRGQPHRGQNARPEKGHANANRSNNRDAPVRQGEIALCNCWSLPKIFDQISYFDNYDANMLYFTPLGCGSSECVDTALLHHIFFFFKFWKGKRKKCQFYYKRLPEKCRKMV